MLGVDLPWPVRLLLVATASLGCASLARRSDVTLGAVVPAIATVLVLAVVVRPTGSRDIWSYVVYGRMLGLHGASPYLYTPSQFPADPFLHLVDWRRSPSVYGPLFNLFAAAGAVLAGPSVLLARLWHQGAAAVALAVALVVVWRRTRDPAALVWLGLHPLLVVVVVNGGHNDLLVGVAVLVACVALDARHEARSGAAIAGGALVKITAGLGLIGAALWAAAGRARPRAWVVVVAAAVVLGVGYLPIAGQALGPMTSHSTLVSRASLWHLPNAVLGIGTTGVLRALPFLGAGGVFVLAVFVAHRRRRDDMPALAVAGSVASYQAAAPYVLPWYCAWSLPSLALVRDAALARWAWWYAAVIATIYQIPIHPSATAARYESPIAGALFPAIAFVTFVLAARAKDGQRRSSGRASVSPAPSTAP